jgi:hypothetical protein
MNRSSAAIITTEMLSTLPEPVRRYFEFSGVVGKPLVRAVTIKQSGRICQAPDKPWMRFRATETYSLDPPGFIWKAKAHRGGFTLFTVRDSYVEGRGGMRVKLAGLFPLVNASGPELDHSSAVRFLNEMMWFPSGYLRPNITWTVIDDTSAEVSLTAYGRSVSGKMYFAPDGRPTNFISRRYKDIGPGSEPQLWSTPATSYGLFCGLNLPIGGQAVWHLESGDFTYIDVRVEEITYDSDDR